MSPPRKPVARSISSRSHSRTSSDTCSLRLRPVWILSARPPTRSFSLRITTVWTSSSVAPRKNSGLRASSRIASKADTNSARSVAVTMPTPSKARANACEPRISASISLRSKWSEPENRSKTSDGPSSNRPPHNFIRISSSTFYWPSSPQHGPESAARSG
jgi:hypothetical protein